MNRNKKIGLAVIAFAAMVLAGFASCSKSNSASASGGTEAASSARAPGGGAQAAKSAGKAAPESDFEVKLNDAGDGCIITKYTGKGGNLVIPATIQGVPVREVRLNPPMDYENMGVYDANQSLISVVIPEGVTKISRFSSCINLKSVTIPDSVTEISEGTFWECTSLASIDIPPSVKKIGQAAFAGSGLTAVTIYAGVEYDRRVK